VSVDEARASLDTAGFKACSAKSLRQLHFGCPRRPEMHLVFECTALAFLRSRYASLFTGSTDTMRSFFAQPDHIGVFHYVVDCLDFMMI